MESEMDAYRDLWDRHVISSSLTLTTLRKLCLTIILALADRGFNLVSETEGPKFATGWRKVGFFSNY